MNKKKIIIIILSVLFIIAGFGTYFYLTSEDKNTSLNIIEKKWIDNNKKVLLDISIFNDIPALNYHGEGIIFDFLDDLEEKTGLEFNKISYDVNNNPKTGLAFRQKKELDDNDILLYQDNYVLVTRGLVYKKTSDIKNITVGVLNNDLDSINKFLLGSDVTFRTFESSESLKTTFNNDTSINAIAVPKLQYLEYILGNEELVIGYNITEYKINYVLSLDVTGGFDTLNNILIKYYKKWNSSSFDDAFNKRLISNYFTFTGEESQSNAKFHSKRYVYGFVINKPYDLISNGELIGINSTLIADFTKRSNVVVEYKKYNNMEELVNAFNANEIDFFQETNSDIEYKMDIFRTVSPFDVNLTILTKKGEQLVINSVNSLLGKKVAVLKNSKIEQYLKQYDIELISIDNTDDLVKTKKANIIALDSYNYQYYSKKQLKNYNLAYQERFNDNYKYIFRDISDNVQFEKLFNFYLTYNDNILHINRGINDTLSTNLTAIIIRNIIILLSFILFIGLIFFIIKFIKNKTNKNRNNLSKGDKLKYIDRLTSLKNRNYLDDNIEVWDNSEIYPQTIIVIDLNDIAYINDNYGHSEGDSVIKEAANILIQNQLANSEIIRTNGNEFLIYLVSYDEKQVISYMRKLNKEFKELAHGFGAAMGYSIITDAIKTIDDAVNEATLDMRNNKEDLSKD